MFRKLFRKSPAQSRRPKARMTARMISDRRWIHRNQLRVGMYVAELDRPWSETRFMFQGFRIDDAAMLEQVRDCCEYACVQTEKLAQLSTNSQHRLCGALKSQRSFAS